ncbi:MAG: class I SAM-dependent methyltransferase [Planctomycetota bacterium]|jgi:ubiquinone/menaquinone biosynthesis C-methylase UbiE
MRGLGDLRGPALERAHGAVLEVGFGTGLNLRYYPSAVRFLAALDPLQGVPDRVQRRIARASFPVERFELAVGDELPFEDERFDCVVTTWSLCSIERPLAALAEMRRVLRRGGLYLLLEHGRSNDPRTARWQRRLNPLHKRIAGGCELVRPIDRLVEQAGFGIEKLDRFVHDRGPRIFNEMYRAVATRER